MLKISNFEVMGWEHAIRGMRNPMNSWAKSDSEVSICECEHWPHDVKKSFARLGSNDLDLMKRLSNASTVLLVIFKEDIMWRKETIKNKIYALVLIGIGALSILPENDATAFIFFCLIGVPLFFAKENWIMDGGGSDYVYEESRRESVRIASNCRRKESDGYRNPQAARRVRSQTR